VCEEFNTANVGSGKDHNWGSLIQANEEWPSEHHPHLRFAGHQCFVRRSSSRFSHVLYVVKSLGCEERFGNILRCLTDTARSSQSELGRFRRRLGGEYIGL
jgi:hypothetical protein